MSFKYFLGMVPEEDVIDASSLCKFRKLRLKDMDLLDLLINKTVTLAIEKGIIKSTSIIVDATHTGSGANPHSPIDILKLRSKQLRKSLYEVDENIKEILPQKNTDDILEHELTYAQTLIDTLKIQEICVCIPKVKEKRNRASCVRRTYGAFVVQQNREKKGAWNQAYTYYFDVQKCKCCSKREGCYKTGAKSKTYSVPIKTDEQLQQIKFQQTERFKRKAAEHYKIEAKNAELKQVYGYDRAQSYGLSCMNLQGAMTIFAANLKRILKLS